MYDDKETEEKYLTLDQLGTLLRRLSKELPGTVVTQRYFLCPNFTPILLRMDEPGANIQ